jgi:hypothetical protein
VSADDREPLKGRPWTPAELMDLAARKMRVGVDVAAEVLGIGHTAAHDRARDTGFLDLDQIVPVRKVSAHRWKVPTSALLRWAMLDEGSPLGPRTRLIQGGTTEGGPRLGPALGHRSGTPLAQEGAPVANGSRVEGD